MEFEKITLKTLRNRVVSISKLKIVYILNLIIVLVTIFFNFNKRLLIG